RRARSLSNEGRSGARRSRVATELLGLRGDSVTASFGRVPDEAPSPDGADWEQEGRRLGESLDDVHLVLVLGSDARQTALAALGIARGQSGKRRVALGD